MKLLQTSNFCGCANLRTGGLIIGYLSLVLDVFSFILGYHWIFSLPDFVVTIPMIFGIHKNRPGCLLPAIVLGVFTLFLRLLGVIIIPVCKFVLWNDTKEFFYNFSHIWFGITASDPNEYMLILWTIFAVFAVTQWYCTAVLCSLYKWMKNENERTLDARLNAI